MPSSAWDQIVETLNTQGPKQLMSSPPNRRIHERKRYTKIVRCVVRLKQDESPPTTFMVRTRNISVGGIGFFFNTYLHPGTRCHVAVLDRHDQGQILAGTLRWCRHVTKTIHECGVQFEENIEVERFVDLATAESD